LEKGGLLAVESLVGNSSSNSVVSIFCSSILSLIVCSPGSLILAIQQLKEGMPAGGRAPRRTALDEVRRVGFLRLDFIAHACLLNAHLPNRCSYWAARCPLPHKKLLRKLAATANQEPRRKELASNSVGSTFLPSDRLVHVPLCWLCLLV